MDSFTRKEHSVKVNGPLPFSQAFASKVLKTLISGWARGSSLAVLGRPQDHSSVRHLDVSDVLKGYNS